MFHASSVDYRALFTRYLGEYFSEIVLSYFRSLFDKADENSILVFMSRKGFSLFEILAKSGYLENVDKRFIVSDKYLNKIVDWSVFKDKKFFVVDDTITTGRQLKKVCDLLSANGITRIEPCAVLASSGFSNSVGLTFPVNCAEVVPERVLHDYTFRVMKLIHNTGIPFTMDLPIYTANVSAAELEVLRSLRLDSFRPETLSVNMDESSEENSFALRYHRNNAGLNFLFEGLRITKLALNDGSFDVQLIPTVIFDRVSCVAAKNYLNSLFETISCSSKEDFSSLKSLLSETLNPSCNVSTLHKTLSYILALRVSQRFFKEFSGIEFSFDENYERYHVPENVARELRCIRDFDLSVTCIEAERHLDIELSACEDNDEEVSKAALQAAELIIDASLFQVKSNMPQNEPNGKPRVLLHNFVKKLGDCSFSAHVAANAVGLASLCSTLRSCSSFIADIKDGYLYKYSYSGENSYYLVHYLLPYYWGLYNLTLSTGDLTLVKDNIDDYTEKFYERFAENDKNEAILSKFIEWIKSANSVSSILSLWSYYSEMEFPEYYSIVADKEDSEAKRISDWVVGYEGSILQANTVS